MAAALFLALLTFAPQQHTLSAPMNVGPDGDVLALSITPDGSRVIYSGDQDTAGVFELYSVPIDGSQARVKLTKPGATIGTLFAPSPDGAWVLYIASLNGGPHQLWRVPPDRSQAPDKLSGAEVSGFAIAADSTRAVFAANALNPLLNELFSVPIDASQLPVRVSGTLATQADPLGSFALSPDSSRVVFQNQAGTRLYSAPIDGSAAPVALFAGVDASRSVLQYAIAPDSSRVLFRADADVDEQYELFSVPLDGSSAPTQLSDALIASGDVTAFQVDPTSAWVTYLADQSTDGVFELYGVPLAGGTPARLSGAMVSGGDVSSWAFTPNGQHVVYQANQDVAAKVELYAAPSDASAAAIKLSGPLVSGGRVLDSLIGPDGTTVAFSGYKDFSNRLGVYRVPIDASAAPVRLVLTQATSDPLDLQAFTPDGALLTFEFNGLWSVPVDGSPGLVRLDDAFVVPGGGSRAVMTADGSRLAFVGDLTADSTVAATAFSVVTDGGFPPVQLGALNVIAPHGDVQAFALTPDDARAVYVADQDTDQVFELYSVRLDGSQAPLKLSQAMVPGGDVNVSLPVGTPPPLVVTPDSSRVVYSADAITNDVFELFSVKVDGSQAPVRLNGALVSGGDVDSYDVSADSQYVVYVADQNTDGVRDCYSVPVVGGSAPVQLNAGLGAVANTARWFRLSPDGSLVFVNTASGLYRVPIAGGSAVRLVSAGTSISFSPDGSHMVLETISVDIQGNVSCTFHVAPVGGAPTQVFSTFVVQSSGAVCDASHAVLWCDDGLLVAPIDGSSSAQSLVTGFVRGAALTPDGQTVVYTSKPGPSSRSDLYTIPIGGGTPTNLSGTRPVDSFTLTPDGTRSVFIVVSGEANAFVVPVDGSGSAVQLTTPVLEGSSAPRAISPSSNRFVYFGAGGLFGVPLGGCEAPQRLHSAPQNTPALTLDFALASLTNEVVFMANLERSDTVELYLTNYRPGVDALTPDHGRLTGGNVVTVHGSGFSPGSQVFFGGVPAVTTFVDANTLHATVPSHATSTRASGARAELARTTVVDVRVTDCGDEAVLAHGYTYGL